MTEVDRKQTGNSDGRRLLIFIVLSIPVTFGAYLFCAIFNRADFATVVPYAAAWFSLVVLACLVGLWRVGIVMKLVVGIVILAAPIVWEIPYFFPGMHTYSLFSLT